MNASRSWTLSLLVAAGAFAAFCAPVAMAAGSGGAAHAHDAPAQLQLDHGRKWATDAPLREGMGRVRTLVQAQMTATRAGQATPQQYDALAAQVEVEVGRIVTNCKLPPQADAVLHVIVAQLMAGTETMAGRKPGVDRQRGLEQVAAAVNDYGRSFEHRGFQPLKTGHGH